MTVSFPFFSGLFLIRKNIENYLIFCWICFAKEKSSSIFARTFAKAEWVAKPKGIVTEIKSFGIEIILLQYQGEMGEWLKPPVC